MTAVLPCYFNLCCYFNLSPKALWVDGIGFYCIMTYRLQSDLFAFMKTNLFQNISNWRYLQMDTIDSLTTQLANATNPVVRQGILEQIQKLVAAQSRALNAPVDSAKRVELLTQFNDAHMAVEVTSLMIIDLLEARDVEVVALSEAGQALRSVFAGFPGQPVTDPLAGREVEAATGDYILQTAVDRAEEAELKVSELEDVVQAQQGQIDALLVEDEVTIQPTTRPTPEVDRKGALRRAFGALDDLGGPKWDEFHRELRSINEEAPRFFGSATEAADWLREQFGHEVRFPAPVWFEGGEEEPVVEPSKDSVSTRLKRVFTRDSTDEGPEEEEEILWGPYDPNAYKSVKDFKKREGPQPALLYPIQRIKWHLDKRVAGTIEAIEERGRRIAEAELED